MQLRGLHHVTAVTGNAPANVDFYSGTLALRLVKKTVNQDDVSAYHLFYADELGSPGTDITFFDWPRTIANRPGNDSIARTLFRVNGADAIAFWQARFQAYGVRQEPACTIGGRTVVRFFDPEGQQLALVDDGGEAVEGKVWTTSEVEERFAIRGFFASELWLPDVAQIEPVLTQALEMRAAGGTGTPDDPVIFAMDGGGPGKELWIVTDPGKPRAALGRGGVHHVAFRLRDTEEQRAWLKRLHGLGIPTSGEVDRFWFSSVYFRATAGILFELATDGPGFAVDEDPAALGEKLVLPPFLEGRRAEIEAGLTPLER